MKKVLLFIALVLALAVQTQAQRVNIPPTVMTSSTYGATSDTVTSATAKYLVSAALPATQEVRVAVLFSKISGTVTGTSSLEASVDGTNWFTLTRSNSDSTVASFTLTDVSSQTKSWSLSNPAVRYIRVKTVGSGTMSVRVQSKIYGQARQ